MFVIIKKYIIGVLCFGFLVACDSNSEKHRKTLEETLIESFEQTADQDRERVQVIVSASKEKNYKLAMNELGILSASRMNTPEQRKAIDKLMRQLRFNYEEIEFSKKNKPSEKAQNKS